MASSGGKFKKAVRIIIDFLNVVIGIGAVVLAVITFLDTQNNKWMFPLIFLLGAAMNLLTAVKHLMTERRVTGAIMLFVSLLLTGIAYVSRIAIGGL
ncbi:MAG: hypothetical protein NC223_08455 [Butyrivibrio sp.]|nr:hypothetical protein [Butyrivibrio sp.]